MENVRMFFGTVEWSDSELTAIDIPAFGRLMIDTVGKLEIRAGQKIGGWIDERLLAETERGHIADMSVIGYLDGKYVPFNAMRFVAQCETEAIAKSALED